MLGVREVSETWLTEAKGAYQLKDEAVFHEVDTAVKTTFMLGILKSKREKIKKIHSLLIHFFAWCENPSIEKWDKGWEIIYGWKTVAEISGIIFKSEPIAESVLEIGKRKYFKKIIIAIDENHYIRQTQLAKLLGIEENNLIAKLDSLTKMNAIEKRKIKGAAFLKLTYRGKALAEELKEQGYSVEEHTKHIPVEANLNLMLNILRSVPSQYTIQDAITALTEINRKIIPQTSISVNKSKTNVPGTVDIFSKSEPLSEESAVDFTSLPKDNKDGQSIFDEVQMNATRIAGINNEKEKINKCKKVAAQFEKSFPIENIEENRFRVNFEKSMNITLDDVSLRIIAKEPFTYYYYFIRDIIIKDAKCHILNNLGYFRAELDWKNLSKKHFSKGRR